MEEVDLDLDHRATGRDAAGFAHRGRQLLDALLAAGPLSVNHRGKRLPLVGWLARRPDPPSPPSPRSASLTTFGAGRSAVSARTSRREGRPAFSSWSASRCVALLRTRSLSGALLVAVRANLLNQLDTKPGRALKAYIAAASALDAPLGLAVLLAPYDLREIVMLGDAGSNALGALLGFNSVDRIRGWGRWVAVAASPLSTSPVSAVRSAS